MYKINSNIYEAYLDDLSNLISQFTMTDERTKEVMKNLLKYIEDESAIVGGHIIDNKLASFIWCHERIFGGVKRLHISYFIVDESFRGNGLSKDLINYAKSQAGKLGIDYIDLNVEPDNEAAINVYQKSGFKTEKLQLFMEIYKGESDV